MIRVTRPHPGRIALRVLAAAGLAVDAYVHFHLATQFTTVGSTINESTLFRIEAATAAVTALIVLGCARRLCAALGLLVAAGGLTAVLLYQYVNVGPLGPLPDMYDPVWFTEKTVSALAQAVTVIVCAALLLPWGLRRQGRNESD